MTISRIHHAAITVADLGRSLDFYQKILGAELLYVGSSETQGVSLDRFQNIVGVRGARLKYAFMKFRDTMFELIYYVSPKGRENDRKHNDIGTPHLAFQVGDIQKAFQELSEKGICFHNQPVEVRAHVKGWCDGWKFTYFTGPDGELLEVFQEMK